jgi:hypothetical protein
MSDKPIFEKLQLKPGRKLLIVNAPVGYLAKAGAVPTGADLLSEPQEAFIIQVFVLKQAELESALTRYAPLVQPGGMLWVTYPKLSSPLKGDINRDTINTFAQVNGWTGISIISIDEDWSALRLKRV